MLNNLRLQALDAQLRRQPVLSIYLALDATNPLDRRGWAIELERAVKPVRASLAAQPHAEREAFEQCVRRAETALLGIPADDGGAAWIAFMTRDGVAYAELVPLHVPTVVTWGEGLRIAPYLRVLSEDVPIVLVIADSAHADIWEYRDGVAEVRERIHAHHGAPEPSHMSAGPPAGFHHGTHGAVAHDEVERRRREGTRRMLDLVTDRALELAGPDGWLLTGGIPHISARLAHLLSKQAPGRVRELEGLDVHASAADVTADARAAARRFGDERDFADVRDVIERATPVGLGVLGRDTRAMLDHSRVRELFLSQHFVARHLGDAEDAVRLARAQGARVVVVAGASAELLDAEGGMAARLRYRLAADKPRSA